MDSDSDDLGKWLPGWRSLQQVFIPVRHGPVMRCGSCDTSERQGRSEHMFAEIGMWVFGIKGIDEQGMSPLDHRRPPCWIQLRRYTHWSWNPSCFHVQHSSRCSCQHDFAMQSKCSKKEKLALPRGPNQNRVSYWT